MGQQADRLAIPTSIEAEASVLGALLIDPDSIFKVLDTLNPSDFYYAKNRFVYEAYLSALGRGIKNPDYMTICDELERAGRLVEAGGSAYLTGLINTTPTALGILEYAKIVRRTAYLRSVILAATKIAQIGYKDDDDDEDVKQAEIEKLIFALQRGDGKDFTTMRAEANDIYDEMDARANGKETSGVKTGFFDIDKLTGGFQNSDMIVIAARPGMGKTSLMMNIAMNAAMMHDKKVAIFSLEMSAEQLVQRVIASEMDIDTNRLRIGKLQDDEWAAFQGVVGDISTLDVFIDDTPSISTTQIRAKLRRLTAETDIDIVIVDYLQLMQADRNYGNAVAEMTNVSKNMKGLAKEFAVPFVVGSQLNRGCEQRQDKRPMLSDLRESGAIEQDADIVAFIYRDEYYNPEGTMYPNLAEILFKKHRNGALGKIWLGWNGARTSFFNVVIEEIPLN
jgi:replicative DNA helicase